MSSDPASEINSATRKRDPTWEHTILVNPKDPNGHMCPFCGKKTNGGISRAKEHLIGTTRKRKNTTLCRKVPQHVKDTIIAYQGQQEQIKRAQAMEWSEWMPPDDVDVNLVDSDDEEDDEADTIARKKGKSIIQEGQSRKAKGVAASSGASNTLPLRPSKKRGPMDAYVTLDPEQVVKKRKALKQTGISDTFNKEAKERTLQYVARWFYQAGIPFNTTRLESFKVMVEAIGQYGPNLCGPSYHQLRVPLLRKGLAYTDNLMEGHKKVWATKGCSLMSDGWTDRRGRTLINFLVNCPLGSMFVESIDASSVIKTTHQTFEMLSQMVLKVGEKNVIQVVSDNASSYVSAGRLLEATYPNLYWTPCAAHCIDLILEDIGKIPRVAKTIKRAIALSGFIYNHTYVLNMMREFTNKKELIRPAITRFATSDLTLSSIYKQKDNLRRMFTSEKWMKSKWAKDPKGKMAYETVMVATFWNEVLYIIKATGSLVRVLRLVDNEKKPAMGYIYEAMDRAKETIEKSFFGNESKYREIYKIIDDRWEIQLHRPLHAAGHYLNPEYFYDNPAIQSCEEIMKGLYLVIGKLTPNLETQDKIDKELSIYKNAEGLFGLDIAKRNRKKKSPAEWWESYGGSTPNLQHLAVRILSLTCSATGCERNWSVFEHIHSKKRNRLEQKRLNDLVYIKYNQALKARFDRRDVIEPITLKDIDGCNEWLVGEMGVNEEGHENERVYEDDDDFTWGQIAAAAGLDEPRFHTRSSTSASRLRGNSGRGAQASRHVQEEEEIDLEDDDTEEDLEGYKSIDDSEDDDDDLANEEEDEEE